MSRVFCVFLLLGLSGCLYNIDRVAPMSWTYYLGEGHTENEIRSALLECGSNVPGDNREFFGPDGNFYFQCCRLTISCW